MTSLDGDVLGAVLAGGESRRFGTDKADAVLAGRTLLERAYATLGEVFAQVVVVSSRPDTPYGPWETISDLREACGPLGGIEAALSRAKAEGLAGTFVLACDLPGVDADVVRTVVDAHERELATAPRRSGEPDFEPLCALYRSECLSVASRLLDDGRRSARSLFEAVEGVQVDGLEGAFVNVNTPADLAEAAARREDFGE